MSGPGFDVAESEKKIIELEKEISSPDFWNEKKSAAGKVQELSLLKERIKEFKDIHERSEMITELGEDTDTEKELSKLERKMKNLEKAARFSGRYDKSDAILNIQSGAGGEDASDWAGMLLKMYQKFASRRGWTSKALDRLSLEVSGPYAYGYLKKESGVHRLVRVSPFSSKGLRHTSFALVEVLPEIKGPPAGGGELKLEPSDLRVDTFRSSGPGGQHMQKTESAVRVTHIPSGVSVSVQAERSQLQNKQKAMRILESKIARKMEELKLKELSGLKPELASGIEWGNQIRSYVLNPYKLVKDHRTGVETTQIEDVLEGNIDAFIE